MITIFVRFISCRILTFEVERTSTVQSLHEKVFDREGIPPEEQLFFYSSMILDPDAQLLDYNMQKEANVTIILRAPLKTTTAPKLLTTHQTTSSPDELKKFAAHFNEIGEKIILQAGNHFLIQLEKVPEPWVHGKIYAWVEFLDPENVNFQFLTPLASLHVVSDPKAQGQVLNSTHSEKINPLRGIISVFEHTQQIPIIRVQYRKQIRFASPAICKDVKFRFKGLKDTGLVTACQKWAHAWLKICGQNEIDFSQFQTQMEQLRDNETNQMNLFAKVISFVKNEYQNTFEKMAHSLIPNNGALRTHILTFFLCLRHIQPNFPRDLRKLLFLNILASHGISSFWDFILLDETHY